MNLVEKIVEENRYLEVAGSSIIGTRQYQQDYACLYSDREQVFGIICDGMGGLSGGERASEGAVKLFAGDYLSRDPSESIPAFLEREAARMDELVYGLKNDQGNLLQAGTTVVAAVVLGNQLYWLSVGDSKIYIIRGKEIQPVTREHNYRLTLQTDFSNGIISRETYETEEKTPQAEALTSFLGMGGLKLVDVTQSPFTLIDGDIVLLCSDGLYKSLDESQIHAMVRDNDLDMMIAADRLTDMALQCAGGGQDNTSVVLIMYRNAQNR